MKENKPTVIVLSRSYSTGLSVIRSLGMAGYTVKLVASCYKHGAFQVAACSKYVSDFTEVVSPKLQEGGNPELVAAILKYAEDGSRKPVLFPTDDYTTSVMDQNRDVLEEHFIMPTIVGGGNNCLTDRMDKTLQAEMAKEAGLLTPQEWIISLAEETIEIPEDMVYPCFCKPIESVTGYKKEMAKCKNRKALKKHLRKLKRAFPNRSILVQEFLKIDNEIDLSGVCLDQEIIIPAIIRKWNVAKYERGVTMAGKVVPFEELGDLQEKIIAMLKKFRYVGMFDMELNIVGDQIYFNEVNLRSGGPNFAYFMSGVNLPALYVKEATGQKHLPEEEKITKFGQSFVYEKVAWEDYLHGYMNKRELKERLEAADITLLYNREDPAPGRRFRKQMFLSLQKRKVKKKIKNVKDSLRKVKRSIKRTVRKFKKWTKKQVNKLLRPLRKLGRAVKYRLYGYPQVKKCNQRNPYAEKPRVIVAGRNFSSNLCMARSLGQAGYEVESLRIYQRKPRWKEILRRMTPEMHSDYVKAYHVCISNRKSQRIVNKLIKIADPYRKMLLIPCDDLVANIADEYYRKLSPYYVMPNVENKKGKIGRLMSKEVQTELAREAGLPLVNSCRIRARKGKFEIPETVTYPCFIKPNVSKNSSKSKMRRCDSEEELREVLTAYSAKKRVDMLVEDFIDIKQEYALLGLSTREGVITPGFFVTEEGGHDAHRGVAMIGRILPTAQQQKLIDDITAFVASLNFEGLFDVDLIEAQDGTMYFTELNLRFGASGYAVTQSGVNLPGMFADYMLFRKPLDQNCAVEPGKRFISEKIMLDEYVAGYLTKEEMMRKMDEVDIHFIQDEVDPRPYRYFRKFYFVADLMKSLIRLKAKLKKTEA